MSEHAGGTVVLTDCRITRITHQAFLVEYNDTEFWIGKSFIEFSQRDALEEGDEGISLAIPEWLAKKENLQ